MSPQRVSSTNALLLSLFCSIHLVSSQSTASSTATASTSTPSFTYPNYVFGTVQLVSYNDTIRASWVSIPDNQTAILQIQCWNRNATTTPEWVENAPDFTSNITTLAVPPPTYVDVPLTSYKAYDPCRFLLFDTFNGSHTFIASGAIGINDTVGKEELVWSVDNPAPMGDLKASLQASTAAARFSTGAAWLVAYIGAITLGLAL